MGSTSKTTYSDPLRGPKAFQQIATRVCLGQGFGTFFTTAFPSCVVRASGHDVGFENSHLRSALRTEGILMPGILPALLFALHFRPAWCSHANVTSISRIASCAVEQMVELTTCPH